MVWTHLGRTLVTAGAVLAGVVATALPAAADPPGNNGTVKIDDVAFDDHPNNEPHVGCTFQVDFYGFDKGDLDATVTFETVAPTDAQVLLTDTVFIGEDDKSGGGSAAGLDASETYTLDFTGVEPHPQQGFHVRLTIQADGSQGADTKHKVFWVSGCVPPPPCPTNKNARVASFGFVRTSGGVETTYGPTTPPDRVLDTATLLAGDHLEAFFTIAAGCEPLKVSLVVYCAEAGWDLTQQTVHDFDSGFFGPNGVHTLDIDIPPLTTCRYFQVDFVRGSVIWQFSPPNGTYAAQGRLLDFYRGSPA